MVATGGHCTAISFPQRQHSSQSAPTAVALSMVIPVLSPCTYMTISLQNKKIQPRIDSFSIEQVLFFRTLSRIHHSNGTPSSFTEFKSWSIEVVSASSQEQWKQEQQQQREEAARKWGEREEDPVMIIMVWSQMMIVILLILIMRRS